MAKANLAAVEENKMTEETSAAPRSITVDDGIPVPEGAASGRAGKYPWDDLQPGQSFFVPGGKPLGAPKRLKDEGRKFTSRSVTENDVKGSRTWRTE